MLETKATLRITSAVRTLSELKDVLGQPSQGFSKGDLWGSAGKLREQTLWALESRSPRVANIEVHLQELCAFVDSVEAFEKIREDCEIDFFCMLSTTNGQGGASLSHRLMGRMAALEIGLVLDIYGDSDES